MPVPRRYSSALLAMLRGSRLYGSPVSGSCTKKVRFSVLCVRNGSRNAVVGSGQQLHVGLVDLLEPADRRAVEHQAVGEDPLAERRGGHGEVLHRARQVTEPDVDELDVSSAMKRRTSSALLNINPPGPGQLLVLKGARLGR